MSRNDNLLGYVAELYYERGLSQKEIGAIINASRPTVSRLIEDAKKQGIVKIIIDTPVTKNAKLSNKLRKTFNLHDAIVVCGDFDFDKSIEICGKAAASLLSTYLQSNMKLGIAWGRCINSVINHLDINDLENVQVAQMVGCMHMGNPNIDGFSAAQRCARKLNGTYTSINAPLFVEGKEVYNYLISEPVIKDSLNIAKKVDIVINGISPANDEKNSIYQSGYFHSYPLDKFLKNGAVATMLGRFIDINGKEIKLDNIYSLSTPLDVLRKVKYSFGINATADKAEATLAVLNGKYINILIVDEPLAKRLLELKGLSY